jgi:hypothetical protein
VKAIVTDMLKAESHIVAAIGLSDGTTDFRRVFRDMGIEDRWILTPGASQSDIRSAFRGRGHGRLRSVGQAILPVLFRWDRQDCLSSFGWDRQDCLSYNFPRACAARKRITRRCPSRIPSACAIASRMESQWIARSPSAMQPSISTANG